jgi:hypothetical protein
MRTDSESAGIGVRLEMGVGNTDTVVVAALVIDLEKIRANPKSAIHVCAGTCYLYTGRYCLMGAGKTDTVVVAALVRLPTVHWFGRTFNWKLSKVLRVFSRKVIRSVWQDGHRCRGRTGTLHSIH